MTRPAGFDDHAGARRGSAPAPAGPVEARAPPAARSTSSLSPPTRRNDFGRDARRPDAARRDRALDVGAREPVSCADDGVEASRRGDVLLRASAWGLAGSVRPGAARRSPAGPRRTRSRVGEVEHGPDMQIDEVDHVSARTRAAHARSVRLPSAPPEDQTERHRVTRCSGRGTPSRRSAPRRSASPPAKNHGALPHAERTARVRREPEREHARRSRRSGPSARARSAHSFVSRSRSEDERPRRRTAGRPAARRASTALPARLRLGVLDAEVDVRQRLDPRLLDRLAAPLADPVGPGVDALEGAIDLLRAGRGRSSRSTGPSRVRTWPCRRRRTRRPARRRRTCRTASWRRCSPRSW